MTMVAEGRDGTGGATPPRWTPSAAELDDVDMVLRGAYRGVNGFVAGSPGREPAPTLLVPTDVADRAREAGRLLLLEEEGVPVAELAPTATWEPGDAAPGRRGLVGPLRDLGEHPRGSHAALRVAAPGPSRDAAAVLGVPVDRPLPLPVLVAVRAAADRLDARVVLFPLTGHGRPHGLDGPALVRTCLAVRDTVAADVVPVAVPRRGGADGGVDTSADTDLVRHVAAAYGATHVAGPAVSGDGRHGQDLPPVVDLPAVALDLRTGLWALESDVPVAHRSTLLTPADVDAHLTEVTDRRAAPSLDLFDVAIHRELRRTRPGGRLGFAVLLTGLSGAGKSTIARALHDTVLERSDRTVTLLDGDIVRRMLSSELTFSREHRALNVRRIGFVAAQITGHGGVALCAPIAPYDDVRREMRAMVESTGAGFVLVHVATPLEVCEERDRKGLYAKARAGIIPEFTGISDPYEVPTDADVVVDTARADPGAAVEEILAVAATRGWIELDAPS
ncbi:adenylyl-sulfate kinase [Actinomycetospora aeridis]|uniref:adenylyl-sulfate kinase n=1 Tax=Actinomycetospora aeridis TaxID=3129231 RepID=A0ABU8N6B9_9PSEU